jgi:hypothetical protein
MKKVKIKANSSELEALLRLLEYFLAYRDSYNMTDLDRLLVASVELLRLKLIPKSMWVFTKPKTFTFNIAEGFTFTSALNIYDGNDAYDEAVRLTTVMELQMQLPK